MTTGYGIVGAGYFGAELARILTAIPSAHVSTVLSPDGAQRLADEVGAVVVGSAEEMAARDDVDAIVVASPNHAHREPVLAAARHGKHIFCEKPIALSATDCDAMVSAARQAGVLFMAGHVTHFMHGVRAAKRILADGSVGDLLHARAVRTGWENPRPTTSWKKVRALSGGHLYHHIHELDLLLGILGAPERVVMMGGNVAHHGEGFGDEDDLLLAILEFPGNRFATVELGSAFRWPEHHVVLQATEGAIRIDLQNVGVEVRTPLGSERLLLHRSAEEDAERAVEYGSTAEGGGVVYGAPNQRPPLWLRSIMRDELDYFQSLLDGAAPDPEFAALTDGTAAALSIRTADALTRSLAERRTVTLDEV